MISRLRGKLVHVHDQSAVIETGGVSYEVMVPTGLAERLRQNGHMGEDISFDTIYYIEAGDRKSNHYPRLVGFIDPVDREFFHLFTQVPGLGVKKALKCLILPIKDIASAIENKDAATLSRLPGVGGRLADKIIAELHGKTAKFALSKAEEALAAKTTQKTPIQEEALEVLVQLQYSRPEAEAMIEDVLKKQPKVKTSEELITLIFKSEQHRKVTAE